MNNAQADFLGDGELVLLSGLDGVMTWHLGALARNKCSLQIHDIAYKKLGNGAVPENVLLLPVEVVYIRQSTSVSRRYTRWTRSRPDPCPIPKGRPPTHKNAHAA